MSESNEEQQIPLRQRIAWVQILVPLLVVAMTGLGTVVWYLITQSTTLASLHSNAITELAAVRTSITDIKARLKDLEAFTDRDSVAVQSLRSDVENIKGQLDAGTDDRFRGQDFERERRIIEAELKGLEQRLELLHQGVDKRIAPMERHFQDQHWTGGHE